MTDPRGQYDGATPVGQPLSNAPPFPPVLGAFRACLVWVALFSLGNSCAAHRPARATPRPDSGRAHFQSYCAACHQYDGQGMGDAPPLTGSAWVSGPESRLIKIVLHGIRGPIEVAGKTYDREMPGFAPVLSDADVASLVSFVRTSFGAPNPPVTPEVVGRIRAAYAARTDYWNAEDLLKEP